jgi:hypothetical protein
MKPGGVLHVKRVVIQSGPMGAGEAHELAGRVATALAEAMSEAGIHRRNSLRVRLAHDVRSGRRIDDATLGAAAHRAIEAKRP